jgi:hypothetical protein
MQLRFRVCRPFPRDLCIQSDHGCGYFMTLSIFAKSTESLNRFPRQLSLSDFWLTLMKGTALLAMHLIAQSPAETALLILASGIR